MGAKFRALTKDFLVYGLGDAAVKASGLITLPVFTRIFNPEEYGVWSLITSITGLLSSVLALGGPSAYARYYFEAKTEEEKRIVTSTWIFFIFGWSLFIVLLSFPLAGPLCRASIGSYRYRIVFLLALWWVPILIIHSILGQVLRNRFLAAEFSFFNVLTVALSIGCSLYAVLILNMGLAGLAGGTLAGFLLIVPARLWRIRHELTFAFSIRRLKLMLDYGLPLVPMSIAYWIFGTSDRLVLAKLSTLAQLGLYGVANNVTSGLVFLSGSLGGAWSPHALLVHENEPEKAPEFFHRIFLYITVGFGILCVGLSFFAKEVIHVLSARSYAEAADVIGPLTIGVLALATTHVTALGISLKKKTRYFINASWAAALLNLALNIIFVPRFGMMASAWATAASLLFLTALYAKISQTLYPIPYDWKTIFPFLCVTILAIASAPYLFSAVKWTILVLYGGMVFFLYRRMRSVTWPEF